MSVTVEKFQSATSFVCRAESVRDSSTYRSVQPLSSTDTLLARGRSLLCRRCHSLHLDRITASAAEEGSLSTLGFETALRSLNSSCPLCNLLQNVAPGRNRWAFIDVQRVNREPDERVVIQEIALYSHNHLSRKSRSKVVIEKSRLRHPLAYRDLQRIAPLQIHYSALKRRLDYCTAHHQELGCGRRLSVNIQGLRVINCATRRIELATAETKYTALTYVWGPPTDATRQILQQYSPDFLPEVAEKTVEDAIIVTERMGFQFIWIDRYCIDQGDSNKHHQIRQMDLIYRNAELTIVAAAGDDPHFGIPGVSTTPRGSLSIPVVGNFAFLALDSQEKLVRNSKWNSRAWTYQEFRFSRRRLVFTENEASFCCCIIDMTTGSEANGSPVSWQRNTEESDSYSSIRWIKTAYGAGSKPWHIADRISEYSKKDLTYPSDALNAFSGILRAFEDLKNPVYHVWGVPVLPPVSKCNSRNELPAHSSRSTDIAPILRSSLDGFIVGLCWKNSGPTTRRSPFPSWSWAGWQGPIGWNSSVHPYQSQGPWAIESGIDIDIELSNGKLMTWKKFEKLSYLKDDPSAIGQTLHVRDVYTIQLRLIHVPDPTWWRCKATAKRRKPGFYAEFINAGFETCYTPAYFLDTIFEHHVVKKWYGYRTFTAVVLGTLKCHRDYPFALLVDESDGVAQRIGHLNLGIGQVFTRKPKQGSDGEKVRIGFSAVKRRNIRIG